MNYKALKFNSVEICMLLITHKLAVVKHTGRALSVLA